MPRVRTGVPRDGRGRYDRPMSRSERDILERAILCTTEQAANANAILDEAMAAGLGGHCAHAEPASHPTPKLAR